MAIANVTLGNTYDEWRAITNQVITFVNEIDGQQIFNVSSNSAVLTVTPRVSRNGRLFINLNVSSNLLDTSTLNVATISTVNAVYSDIANTSFKANLAYAAANTANYYAQYAIQTLTNTVLDSGNFSALAYAQANTGRTHANLAFLQANAARTIAISAFDTANVGWNQANLAYAQANTGGFGAVAAFTQANTSRDHANVSFEQANTARSLANASIVQANTARTHANGAHITANAAFDQANTTRSQSNSSFAQANTARNQANTAFLQANAAYDIAASAVPNLLSFNYIGNANNAYFAYGKNETHLLISANNFANTKFANVSGSSYAGNLQFPTGNVSIGIGSSQGVSLFISRRDAQPNIFPEIATFAGSQGIRFNSNTSFGAWNDLTLERDLTIIYSRGNFDDGANLVIAPWSDFSFGYKQDGEGRHGFNTSNPRYTIDANGSVNVSETLIVAGQDISVLIANGVAAANAWANTQAAATGAGANSYTRVIGAASNTLVYNAIANTGAGANSYAITVTDAANSYTRNVGAASNTLVYSAIANTGAASNAYTVIVGAASNTLVYNAIANTGAASNAYTVVVGAASNTLVYNAIANTGAGANAYSITLGASSNAWTNTSVAGIGLGANAYSRTVGDAGNTYSRTVGDAGNTYSRTVGDAGNTYTRTVGDVGNTYTRTVGTAGNTYTITVGAASNTYAISVGAAGNTYAATVGAAGNTFTGLVFTHANNAYAKANAASVTVTNDTLSATRYVVFTDATSGTTSRLNVASTRLTFNPSTGTLTATNFSSASDMNKKENITVIADAMSIVEALNGVRFTWKDTGEPSAGIIAQDLQKVMPELVEPDMSVSYSGIIGILIEAIKELNNKIKILEEKQG